MKTTKITKRERYATLISLLKGEITVDKLGEDYIKFCEGEIDALDRKNEKAKEAQAKKKAESDELLEKVAGALTEEFRTIPEIMVALDDDTITQGMVVNRLTKLVGDARAEKGEASVNAGGKARKLSAYRAI